MGITEYVPTKHTFSVLICAFDEDSARIARLIQRSCQQICGLYTHSSISNSQSPIDSLYDLVAKQYHTIIFILPKVETDPAVAITGHAADCLRSALPSAAVIGTCRIAAPITAYPPHAQIMLSPRALDEPEIYRPIANQVAAAIVAQL
jgi:hypothetical protein